MSVEIEPKLHGWEGEAKWSAAGIFNQVETPVEPTQVGFSDKTKPMKTFSSKTFNFSFLISLPVCGGGGLVDLQPLVSSRLKRS